MTKEATVVFAKFGTLALIVLFVLVLANRLAGKSHARPESPWSTFNPTKADVHDGRILMERNGCFSCHSIDGFGGRVGPALNGVNKRKSEEELFLWIKSPWSIKPGTPMPQYGLPDESILKVISYLETKDSLLVQP